jgi:hypothetical protein
MPQPATKSQDRLQVIHLRIYDWLPDSVQFTFQHEEEEEEEEDNYFDIQFPYDEYKRASFVESPH